MSYICVGGIVRTMLRSADSYMVNVRRLQRYCMGILVDQHAILVLRGAHILLLP